MLFHLKLIAVCIFAILLASCSSANKIISVAPDNISRNYKLRVIMSLPPGIVPNDAVGLNMINIPVFGNFSHPFHVTYQVHNLATLRQLQDNLLSTGMVINMTVEKL